MGKLRIEDKTTDRLIISVKYTGLNGRKRIASAIIDTGAYVTYIGIAYIRAFGSTVDLGNIKLGQLRPMYGITDVPLKTRYKSDEKICASFPIKLKNIIFDDIEVSSPTVRVPVSFCYDSRKKVIKNIKFEREDLFLIGTDILRNYNYAVNIDSIPFFMLSNSTASIPLRENINIPNWDFED